MNIAALLTCHNRKEQTLACLRALFSQELRPECRLVVYLTDDGSCDGTAVAVRERFPEVCLLAGDGTLFWNGGMRLAFGAALKGNYDYYLWLNDDTLLDSGVVAALLRTHTEVLTKSGAEAIVVGSTRSPQDGSPTYGGVVRRSRLRRTRFSLVEPAAVPVKCETMNGNCVLVPHAVAARVGILDRAFVHGMGDFDYGLRACAAGFAVWVMPGFVGVCEKNALTGTFYDDSLPLAERWRKMCSPKGLSPSEWRVFCKRHAGLLWPVFFFWPYLRVLFRRQI
jgi:GT2 family glycosyltransferase